MPSPPRQEDNPTPSIQGGGRLQVHKRDGHGHSPSDPGWTTSGDDYISQSFVLHKYQTPCFGVIVTKLPKSDRNAQLDAGDNKITLYHGASVDSNHHAVDTDFKHDNFLETNQ